MNLYAEPEMMRVASCTFPVQSLLEIEAGFARVKERHKGQGTNTVSWNLKALVLGEQEYSWQCTVDVSS